MKKAAGFTLLELLLVLVLIGMGSGLAIVSVDKQASRSEERRWLDRTQQELRRLRNKAVLSGVPVPASINFEQRTIATVSGAALKLPERYRLYPVARDQSLGTTASEDRLELLFFPDGTMQDASFAMVTPSGLRQDFHLEKISGRIERLNVAATR